MDGHDISYEEAKRLARDPDPTARARVAAGLEDAPELLYFLAEDPDPDVRRAVAANRATPSQANLILARDRDYGVRCALAHKVVGDGLGDDERRGLWRMGFTILETLAADQVVRVRRILSRALHSDAEAPHGIVLGLARDREPEIARPVLENSPVLSDGDLIDILDDGAPGWAQEAIAGRAEVSTDLAQAIVRYDSANAVRRLIENPGARIGESTIERIVDRAPEVEAWHAPLVYRPSLSQTAILGLARFVAGPLLKVLRRSQSLDAATETALDSEIARRGDDPPAQKPADRADSATAAPVPAPSRRDDNESPEQRAVRLQRAGRLDDEAVSLALAGGERGFVTAALALRAGLSLEAARRIVSSRSAKAVTALAWKGKFPMRFAVELQRRLAAVAPNALIYARAGTDYPLTPKEMNWHLELFGD